MNKEIKKTDKGFNVVDEEPKWIESKEKPFEGEEVILGKPFIFKEELGDGIMHQIDQFYNNTEHSSYSKLEDSLNEILTMKAMEEAIESYLNEFETASSRLQQVVDSFNHTITLYFIKIKHYTFIGNKEGRPTLMIYFDDLPDVEDIELRELIESMKRSNVEIINDTEQINILLGI